MLSLYDKYVAQKMIDERLKIQSMNKMSNMKPEDILGHFFKRNDIGPDGVRTKTTDQEANKAKVSGLNSNQESKEGQK